TLAESATARRTDIRWPLAQPQPGSPKLLADWARARGREWSALVEHSDSSMLRAWIARSRELYGASIAEARETVEGPRTTDVFNLLGGRAALRETLQLQLLRPAGALAADAPTISLSTLKGVTVKALPFDTMLGGKEGGRLPLAEHVPIDRLFLYFAKPTALFPFLDHGAEFLFRAGSLVTSSAVDDDLKTRYLRRLGLTENLGRKFIESGEVTELALVT